MSGEVSYDVYVKGGVDRMGRDAFGEAERWFWDYSRVPEYDPALEPAPYREPSGGPRASWKSCMGKTPAALRGAREDSEPRRRSWRWGSFRFS